MVSASFRDFDGKGYEFESFISYAEDIYLKLGFSFDGGMEALAIGKG